MVRSEMNTFIIAEIGPNHNGCLETAMLMIKEIAKTGADAVKFQLAIPQKVYSSDAFKANYQKENDGDSSVIEMSRRLQLPYGDHAKLASECSRNGIMYLCTAFDLDSLVFLDQQINVPVFKVASGEITSLDILEYISVRNKPVLLSTGMATYGEINDAISVLNSNSAKDITLLHCVSNYPAPVTDINLRVMPELARRFKCKVGYSDHSLGQECCLAAVTLGANVIEKHVTLDKNMSGPDHKASATIEEFSALVCSIRNVESALGINEKILSREENAIRLMARKSIVAARHIPAGEIIASDCIAFKRPGTGFSPMQREKVIGKRALIDIMEDRVVKPEDIGL